MIQWLKVHTALTALGEDLSSVPKIHTKRLEMACKSRSRGSDTSSLCLHTYEQTTYMHIITKGNTLKNK